MSLEEDILLNQFGQGVRSLENVLDEFVHLEDTQQWHRFFLLYCRLGEFTWHEDDIEQVLADCAVDHPEAMYNYLNLRRFTTKSKHVIFIPHSASPPDDRLDQAYKVLLTLFKLNYQRHLALDEHSTSWWRRDLSDPDVVQGILTEYRVLLEQVYADPSYRSEFTCLAKIQRDNELRYRTPAPEPKPTDVPQTHFDFLTYDELTTKEIELFTTNRGPFLLRQSLAKALSKQYGLSKEQVNRLVADVVERHLRGIMDLR